MKREYHSWFSPSLHRDMPLMVYGHAGAKVLVFPTREGDYMEYERLRMPDQIRDKLDAGYLQLFCIDYRASETFYCWWAHPSGRINRHLQYERYILEELFPFMDQLNPNNCIIAHGCSLGAYLAATIAFRHPDRFQKLAAFSGRFDLTEGVEWFGSLLDGHYDNEVYFNTPTHFLPGLDCDYRLSRLREMDIILTIGKEDPFRGNNEYLSQILNEKGISHQLHIWDERAHSGYYWRQMARIYI